MVQQRETLLEVKNLHSGFTIDGDFYNAVQDVSFDIKEKEVVCVVGESGCGKSVMSLSLMKLLPKENAKIASGEVLLNGTDIVPKSQDEMNKIRGKDMAMIFQEPMTALNPVLTIGFQLNEVLYNHTGLKKKEATQQSIELLKQVGISRPESIMDEYPHQLSGGMRQRIMIAMAIALEPKLLIADEPTTALDVTIQAQILELLKDIQERKNMSILLITHDLGVVAELADRVVVMYAGEVIEQSDVDSLFYDPKHPYTEALLSSIPRLEEKVETLNTIGGVVPSLRNMPQVGCRFADRCPKASDHCTDITPKLADVGGGHYAKCLLYEECYPTESEEVRR